MARGELIIAIQYITCPSNAHGTCSVAQIHELTGWRYAQAFCLISRSPTGRASPAEGETAMGFPDYEDPLAGQDENQDTQMLKQ